MNGDTQHGFVRFHGKNEQKFARLLYYKPAIDAWCPSPDDLSGIIQVDDMVDGEWITVQFKRLDMTDAEYAAIPEE